MAITGGKIKRKKLGQHFLVDPSIAEKIVNASGLAPGVRTLEVGPGQAFLTRRLLDTGAAVHAVELDRELFPDLKAQAEVTENFTVEWGNALKFDFDSIPAPYSVVSNLPYSVAVALIKKFIEHKERIGSMTLMIQAEVARRLTAGPGDPEYGTLSLYTSYHCQTEYLFAVPPEAFKPRPKVESAVVKLTPREKPAVDVDDEDRFFQFLKTAFAHRRKQLRNNIRGLFENGDTLSQAMKKAGIEQKARPQDVSLERFAVLYGAVE